MEATLDFNSRRRKKLAVVVGRVSTVCEIFKT